MMPDPEIVLSLGTAGGSLQIYRAMIDGKFMFKMTKDDQTPTLLDEDPIHSETTWLPDIQAALDTCRWPWNRFYPMFVHDEYRVQILRIKQLVDQEQGCSSRCLEAWNEICGSLS